MRRNSTRAMGALHPIIFFVIVYGISLCMAFMVCTSVYNFIHNDDLAKSEKSLPATDQHSVALAMNNQ